MTTTTETPTTTRAQRKAARRELAAWLRAHDITPTGAAWDAATAGERDVTTLRTLNTRDGASARRTADGRRTAAGLRDGDILETGTVVGDPVTDPETLRVWVTVRTPAGELVDVDHAPTVPLEVTRPRRAPAWVQAAAADYRDARDAWEARRESTAPAPTTVPGVAHSSASYSQLTDGEYAAAYPRPVFADFLSAHADRMRADA